MDKCIHDDKGTSMISNDSATIMNLFDIVHPIVDITKSQDVEACCLLDHHCLIPYFFMFPFYKHFMHQLLNVAGSGLLKSLQNMDVVYYVFETLNFKLEMGP
jgi:hypothetical protein